MKKTKMNLSVNIAFSYIKVVVIIFPFFVISTFLFSIINYNVNNNSNYLLKADTFNLFINISRQYGESLIKVKGIPLITVISIFLSNFFFFSLIFYVLLNLKKFLKNICEENDLSVENGKILKNISVFILLIAFSIKVLRIITDQLQVTDILGNNIRPFFDLIEIGKLIFDPILIICVVTFIIGNVIIRGAEIKQENDLTV